MIVFIIIIIVIIIDVKYYAPSEIQQCKHFALPVG